MQLRYIDTRHVRTYVGSVVNLSIFVLPHPLEDEKFKKKYNDAKGFVIIL